MDDEGGSRTDIRTASKDFSLCSSSRIRTSSFFLDCGRGLPLQGRLRLPPVIPAAALHVVGRLTQEREARKGSPKVELSMLVDVVWQVRGHAGKIVSRWILRHVTSCYTSALRPHSTRKRRGGISRSYNGSVKVEIEVALSFKSYLSLLSHIGR